MKYAFIEHELSGYPVAVACEALEVSPAGYHAWRVRPEAPRTQANRELSRKIKEIFLVSGKTYGASRVAAELREKHGYVGSVNRIKRLMREAGLHAKAKRKFKATTDSNHALPVAPNLLQQNFEANRPNDIWLSDITYIWTKEGLGLWETGIQIEVNPFDPTLFRTGAIQVRVLVAIDVALSCPATAFTKATSIT